MHSPKLSLAETPRAIECSAINPHLGEDQMNPNIQEIASNAVPINGLGDSERTKAGFRSVEPVLSEEKLARFAARAAAYDRKNRFFQEDFDELRASKYLLLPVPLEFCRAGMTVAEVCQEQLPLAYCPPATALAVNMHLYWVGLAADLGRRGDHSLEWILSE